ncbi:MAG: methanogenesis marker 9 domain-containing protein [Promethearchaeota archaeon]|jgi:predicted metal-binding transcription factor (methanogenesis marker protein 9)
MPDIKQDKLRDVPGWEKNAPVPICMGGDLRALTFCCKPGYSLTFGFKCLRDERLREIGLDPEEFIRIKEEFSNENDWLSDVVCFGSISYCCMRRGGCPRRDVALVERYPGMTLDKIMELYFQKKKELSIKILAYIKNPEVKEKVKELLNLF